MRGGAIPMLLWGALLTLMLTINWIWTGDAIQIGTYAFAAIAVFLVAALLVRSGRQAIRTGAPEPNLEPEALPATSLGAVLAGLSIAMMVFGVAFGKFPIYFGAGLLVLALGRLALERSAERRSRDAWRGEGPR